MPAPSPFPAYTLPSVCWLSCTKFCALFCTATTTAKATTITWHTMFFLPLNFRPVEAPGQTLQQIKQQLQHPPSPLFLTLLHHHYRRHHHHYRLQVIVIVIITVPCHSFCLAWDSLIIYNNVRQTLILIYTLTMLMSAFALASAPSAPRPPSSTLPFVVCPLVIYNVLERAAIATATAQGQRS